MNRLLRLSILLIICLLTTERISGAVKSIERRAYQIGSNMNTENLRAMDKAARYGMTRIQITNKLTNIIDGQNKIDRELLKRVCWAIREARKRGLRVDLNTQAVNNAPEHLINDGKVVLNEDFYDWLDAKYRRLIPLLPDDYDAIVLKLAESKWDIYKDEHVVSDKTPAERIYRMIRFFYNLCVREDKMLIVRTFVHRNHELTAMIKALNRLRSELGNDSRLFAMSKCIPHDWHPYYPYNWTFRQLKDIPIIIEIDLGNEYTGLNIVPYYQVDYVKYIIHYGINHGATGVAVRTAREGYSAFSTPNEVNLYSISRLLIKPNLDTDSLATQWLANNYSREAAPYILKALKRTYDIGNIMFFPNQQWLLFHSRVSSWNYAYKHLTDFKSYSVESWLASPKYQRKHEMLLWPGDDTFIMIRNEKELARRLIKASLKDLECACVYMSSKQFDNLIRPFNIMKDHIEVFEQHALAFYKSLRYRHLEGGNEPNTQNERKRLRFELQTHVDEMYRIANQLDDDYGKGIFEDNSERLRSFAEEIESIIK